MKRIVMWLFALCFISSIHADDLTGVKIYINPGHGGYDSGDRSVATIPFPNTYADETGFWESSSNLTKGLHLRDLLESQNATVIMSRVANTTEDDRGLSTIAAEASANNVDAFLSIHSNAAGTTTAVNYLAFLCPGSVGENDQNFRDPITKALAETCWPHMWDNPINVWTHYSATNTKIACYVTSYTVIGKSLTVPGFLSEGSFHDYKPETHRLLNDDYRKLESHRFYNYFIDYFKGETPKTGIIAGDIRDQHIRMKNSLYLPYISGSKDQWTPINGATVELCNMSDEILQSYTVDNNYNGVYVFWDVAPGKYKLLFSADNYTPVEAEVTVEAGKTANANVTMVDVNYDPKDHRIAPDDYPDPEQDGGTQLPAKFKAEEIANNPAANLNDLNIRRSITKGDKMYVLTDDNRILIVDATTGEQQKELSTEGIEGGIRLLSDIAFTSDTILLACNMDEITLSAPTTMFKVYKWADDDATPEVLFTSLRQGNWNKGEVGRTMTVSGPIWDFKLYTTATTTGSSRQVRIIGLAYNDIDEEVVLAKYMMDKTNYTEALWGENMKFTISPFGGNRFIVDSEVMQPTEYEYNWEADDRKEMILKGTMPAEVISTESFGANYLKYAGKPLMIAPIAESGKTVGLTLFDISEGFDTPKQLWAVAPVETETATAYMMGSAIVSGYDITMSLFAQNQGISKYKTNTSDIIANIYATELKVEKEGDDYVFSFKLNENATDVELAFVYDGAVVDMVNAGAMSRGLNTITVAAASLPEIEGEGTVKLEWQIKATAESVIRVGKLTDNSERFQYYAPYGVAIDSNPESDFFGRVYMTESKGGKCAGGRTVTQGLFVLDAMLEDVTEQGTTAFNGGVTWNVSSSPYRLNVAPDGRIFIADWSDNHAGIWIADPANLDGAFTELFAGAERNSDGLASYNGVNVHGSISSCYVTGTGEDTKLYTLDEDYLVNGESKNLLQYNIGTATSWLEAPSAVVFDRSVHKKIVNANSKMMPDGRGGWWIAQYRASENENEPALLHFNGTSVDFHTGQETLIKNSRNGGLAVSADGSRIATTGQNEMNVWNATYDENGDVSGFTKALSIKNTIGGLGASSNDLAFDPAGNLYYVSNSSERLVTVSLPKGDNSFTTKAPSKHAIELNATPTGIDEVEESEVKVYAQNGLLYVEAAPGETIAIYNTAGSCIAQMVATDPVHTFDIAKKQLVIVKVGTEVVKVMM